MFHKVSDTLVLMHFPHTMLVLLWGATILFGRCFCENVWVIIVEFSLLEALRVAPLRRFWTSGNKILDVHLEGFFSSRHFSIFSLSCLRHVLSMNNGMLCVGLRYKLFRTLPCQAYRRCASLYYVNFASIPEMGFGMRNCWKIFNCYKSLHDILATIDDPVITVFS